MQYPDDTKNYSRLELSMMFPASSADSGPICPTEFTEVVCELRPAVLNYSIWYINPNSIERSRLQEVLEAESGPLMDDETSSKRSRRYQVGLALAGSVLGSGCASVGDFVSGRLPTGSDCNQYNHNLRQIRGLAVIENRDIHEPWEMGANSSLLGIYQTLRDRLRSVATMSYHDERWSLNTTGWLASARSIGAIPTDGSCSVSFDNPSSYVLNQINAFTRQLSSEAALYDTDLDYNYNTTGREYFRDFYHETDGKYAVAAMACTILAVLCILPAFYGFWQLGRDVTMGPLEIAYAFQGPAFTSVTDTNGNVDTLVNAVGDTQIKYGEIHDGTATKFAFKVSRYALPE